MLIRGLRNVIGIVLCGYIALPAVASAGTLGEGLDCPALTWTTSSDFPWEFVTSDTHDGTDAVASVNDGAHSDSWLETTVSGPVSLKFQCRISTYGGRVFVTCDETTSLWDWTGIIANGVWFPVRLDVPAGLHRIRFHYVHPGMGYTKYFNGVRIDEFEVAEYVPPNAGTIEDGLDTTDYIWTTSEDLPWSFSADDSLDGEDSTVSGNNGGVCDSWLATKLYGPGKVSYARRLSMAGSYGAYYKVMVDDAEVISESPFVKDGPWARQEIDIPSGLHELRFVYHHPGVGWIGAFSGVKLDDFADSGVRPYRREDIGDVIENGALPAAALSHYDTYVTYDGLPHSIDVGGLQAAVRELCGDKAKVSYSYTRDGQYSETPITSRDCCSLDIWYKVTAPYFEDFYHQARITIAKRSMENVTIADMGSISYEGKRVTPLAVVTDGMPNIISGEDFTVAYENNEEPGTARAIVKATAQGNYSGSKSKDFTILSASYTIPLKIRCEFDADVTKPSSLQFKVKRDGVVIQTMTVAASDNWLSSIDVESGHDYTLEPIASSGIVSTVNRYGCAVFSDMLLSANVLGRQGWTSISGLRISDEILTESGWKSVGSVTLSSVIVTDSLSQGVFFNVSNAKRTLVPFPSGSVKVSGYSGVYDGGKHSVSATVSGVAGVQVRYARAADGPYSSELPLFSDVVSAATVWCEFAAPGYVTQKNSASVTITKRPVTLTSDSASKAYDGTALTKMSVSVSGSGWVSGQGAAYTYTGAQTDVGSSLNTFTYGLNAGTRADNYAITIKTGTLTVTKRAMSAVSVSDPGVIDYTGAAITPSVTVRDGTPSIVKASDYTVSYADNIQPGTARIILTATADGNYTGTKTVPFTIRKTTFDIDDGTGGEGGKASSFSYAGVYDGLGHGIDVQIANPPAGTMIKYSLGQSDTAPGGTWSTVNPLSTNVCDNVIWYAVECAGYVSYTNNATVTITPRAVSVKSASKSKPYDGTPLKLTAGDISVSSGGGQGLPALPTGESFVYENLAERTDAGQTSATFTIAAGTGTKLTNYAITTEFGTLTVTKATWGGGEEPGTGEIPEGGLSKFDAVREYNGKGQTIDVEKLTEAFAEVVGNDFTVQYAEGESGGLGQPALPAWTTVAPTVKDVGSMIVWYKVTNPNFEDFVHAAKVTVVPKELMDEMVQPGEDAFFFDGNDKKPTVDVIYEVDGQDICTTNDYTLVYGEKADAGWWVTVTGKGNYAGTVAKIVPVLKRPVAPPLVPSRSYTGKTQKPTIPTDSRWTTVSNPGGIDVGEYSNVVLRLTNTTDYKWKGGAEDQTDITLVFKVTKANNGWSRQPGMKGWAYGETPSEPAMGQARYGTVRVAYRKAGADVSTETATRPELPGKYVARFWVDETENFIGVAVHEPYKDIAFEITGSAPGGTETTTTPVPVPHDWLDAYVTEFGGGDYETAANAKGRNGVSLWESYVAGLDPTDPTSQFTASITMGSDGKPVITWEPDMSKADLPRTYVEYGKANLGDKDWTPVKDANRAAMRFFKVGVEIK